MADELLVKNKEIVVPGDKIATGMSFLPGKGAYRKDSDIYSDIVGVISVDGKVIKLVPLSGTYTPKINDRVIGKVIDVLMSGWRITFGSPYSSILPIKDATSEFIPRGADLTNLNYQIIEMNNNWFHINSIIKKFKKMTICTHIN